MVGGALVAGLGAQLQLLGGWLAAHIAGLRPLPCPGCSDPVACTLRFAVAVVNALVTGHLGCPG